MAKTKAQIIAEAQVVKNATEVGENTATRVGGVLEDLADADGMVIIPVTGTSSGGSITLSSNPFTQVQTAVNAGQHVVVRVTVGSDIVDFAMNTYSDSIATYIGTANFLLQEFQMLCNSSAATITNRSTSNTFSTGESVPNVGIDATPTQGSDNLITSGGVYPLQEAVLGGISPDIDVTPSYTSGYFYTTTGGAALRITSNAGSKYSGVITNVSTPPSGGIDVSNYIGRTVKVTVATRGATSSRETVICNESHIVVASVRESDYSADGTAYSAELVVPEGAKWFYWSGTGNLSSVVIKGVAIAGVVEKVDELQAFHDDEENFLTNAIETPNLSSISIKKDDLLFNAYINTTDGGYTVGYPDCTSFIRVVPESSLNVTYTPFSVEGVSTTPMIRVAWYHSKKISSFISYGQLAFGNPQSLNVPQGANYMIVSISIGNAHTRTYYTDDAISFSFDSVNIRYNLTQRFNEIDEGIGADVCMIKRENLVRGQYDNSGNYQIAFRSITQGMYAIPTGYSCIKCKFPNNGNAYLWQLTFYDANMQFLSNSLFDNFEQIEVVSGAVYCKFCVQKEGVAYYDRNIPETDVFYLNLPSSSSIDFKNDIIALNNEGNTYSKLQNVKQPAKVAGVNQTAPLSILFFTDIHGNKEDLQRIMEFYNFYNHAHHTNTYLDVILSGGDNVQVYNSSGAFDYWGEIDGTQNILNCVGNHDAAANSSLDAQSPKKDVYDVQFAPYIANWGAVQPSGAATNGLMYYYKDFATQKIRLVVLDCMYWDSAELTWFESVLSDAKNNGYAVIGVAHYPVGTTTPIECNFLSRDYSLDGGARLIYPIQAVETFINSGGTFICWLSGHAHVDGFGYSAGYEGQLNIINDTASQGQQGGASLLDSKTQDCFNIIGVDTYSKLIKLVRIGRDYDRYMRHIGELCYDYNSHTILYTQ